MGFRAASLMMLVAVMFAITTIEWLMVFKAASLMTLVMFVRAVCRDQMLASFHIQIKGEA